MLSVNGLAVDYLRPGHGYSRVLHEIGFDHKAGESLGIVGESGTSRPSPRAQSPVCSAPRRASMANSLRRRRPVGRPRLAAAVGHLLHVPEPPAALDQVFTVGFHLVETLLAHGTASKAQAWERGIELLRSVGIPEPAKRMNEFPHAFSGGLAQRVMTALSLASDPRLLIAGEPTSALDVSIRAQIIKLLADIRRERQMGLFFISHDIGSVAERCDKLIVMFKGRIVEAGSVGSVLRDPQDDYTRLLLDAIPRKSGTAAPMPAAPAEPERSRLRVENLTVSVFLRRTGLELRAGKVRAVSDVTIDAPAGRFVGIVGESGSGKSTIARSVVGLNRPESGRVLLGDLDLTGLTRRQRTGFRRSRRIQMIWQDPSGSLDPRHSVADVLLRACPQEMDPAGKVEAAHRVLDLVGLPRERPGQTSGGQNRRVAIARALLRQPDIFVADEPTSRWTTRRRPPSAGICAS